MNSDKQNATIINEECAEVYSGYTFNEICELVHDTSDDNDAILKKIFIKNPKLFDEELDAFFDWFFKSNTSLKNDVEFATLVVTHDDHKYPAFSPIVRNDLVLAKFAMDECQDNYYRVGPELRENMELFITFAESDKRKSLNPPELNGEYSEEFVLGCFNYNPATLELFEDFVLTEEFRDILLEHNPFLMLYTDSVLVYNKEFIMRCIEISPVNCVNIVQPELSGDVEIWELACKLWLNCLEYAASNVQEYHGIHITSKDTLWSSVREEYSSILKPCCTEEAKCFDCNTAFLFESRKWLDDVNEEFSSVREIICQPEYRHVFLAVLYSMRDIEAIALLNLADGSKTVSEYHASIQKILRVHSTTKSNRSMVYWN